MAGRRERKEPGVEAAVLVPVYRGEDAEVILVVVRRNEGGVHGGQLGLPGGKRARGDRSLLDTALREAHEEVGIAADSVDILARLPLVETVTSGFRITPYLARIVPPKRWRRSEREIAEILEVRLSDLANPDAHGEETWHLAPWSRPRRVRFYRVGRHKLWGATYRILRPLIPRLLAEEWEL